MRAQHADAPPDPLCAVVRCHEDPQMPLFKNATFEISIAKPGGLPPPIGAEIAFAGRSNAGKSSAINTLTDHNRLAFVSKTPGRTQLINFFRMQCGAALVDLPGYGYAEVPEKIRLQWQGLLERYLRTRENLIGLVVIMDSRHPLKQLDRQMLDWFAPTGRPMHVLLTKSDKLSRGEAQKTLLETRRDLAAWGGQVTVQLFSSLKKQGMDEVERTVSGWLADCAPAFAATRSQETPVEEKTIPRPKGKNAGG